jgi:hypothetical protein
MVVSNNGKPDYYNIQQEHNTRNIKNDYKNVSPTGIRLSETDKLNPYTRKSKVIQKNTKKEKPGRHKNRPIL